MYSYEGSHRIPFGAELTLDSSEVLLNLLIATGFSGAIIITLTHSTVHWLLRGMSMSCVMTALNESQYFVFYFHNLYYKRQASSWIHQCMYTCACSQLGVYVQGFVKTLTKTNSFIKFKLNAFNTESNLCGIIHIYLFALTSDHSSSAIVPECVPPDHV